MNKAGNIVLNDYVQTLSEIEKMETQFAEVERSWKAKFEKVIVDLRALQSGAKSLSDLVVSDDGYEFIPSLEEPNGSNSNGAEPEPTFLGGGI